MTTPIEHQALQEKSMFHGLQEQIGAFLVEALPDPLAESVMTQIKGDPLKELDARLKKTGLAIIVEVTDIIPDGENDDLLTVTVLFHCEEYYVVNHGAGGTRRAVLDVACLIWAAMKLFPDDGPWARFRFGGIAYSGAGPGDAAYDLNLNTTTRVVLQDEASGEIEPSTD